jgi:hypothetical protein
LNSAKHEIPLSFYGGHFSHPEYDNDPLIKLNPDPIQIQY